MTAGIFGGAFVILAVLVIVLVSVLGGSGGPAKGANDYIAARPAPASLTDALKNIPTSELAAAGNGGSFIANVGAKGSNTALVKIDSPITSHGKPELVYMGAVFCPFCAATRWPLTIALDRFGTFKGLQETASSPLDVYSNTRTLDYAKATYSSPYLVFKENEQVSNVCPSQDVVRNTQRDTSLPLWESPAYACNGEYTTLQPTPRSILALATKYDTTAYVGDNANGIPFIDFGGKYIEVSAIYSPAVLHGASWSQIVDSFKAPTQGIGQQVLAAANRYTALICAMTNDKPAQVCDAPYMKAAEKALGK